MPFGVPDEAANTVWTIRGGYGDTADKIAGAIRAQFSAEKDAEAFFGKVTVKRVRTTFLMANSWHTLISRLHGCSHRRSPNHAKSAKSPSSTFWVWPRNPEMSDTPFVRCSTQRRVSRFQFRNNTRTNRRRATRQRLLFLRTLLIYQSELKCHWTAYRSSFSKATFGDNSMIARTDGYLESSLSSRLNQISGTQSTTWKFYGKRQAR